MMFKDLHEILTFKGFYLTLLLFKRNKTTLVGPSSDVGNNMSIIGTLEFYLFQWAF